MRITFCDDDLGTVGETYTIDAIEMSMGKVFGSTEGGKPELIVRAAEGEGRYLGRLVYRDLGTQTDWPHLRIEEEQESHGYVGTVLAETLVWLTSGLTNDVCRFCFCEIEEDDDHAAGCLAYKLMTAMHAEGHRHDHRVLDDTLMRLSVRLPDEDVKALRGALQGLTNPNRPRKETA
jgi:hypothetical protein